MKHVFPCRCRGGKQPPRPFYDDSIHVWCPPAHRHCGSPPCSRCGVRPSVMLLIKTNPCFRPHQLSTHLGCLCLSLAVICTLTAAAHRLRSTRQHVIYSGHPVPDFNLCALGQAITYCVCGFGMPPTAHLLAHSSSQVLLWVRPRQGAAVRCRQGSRCCSGSRPCCCCPWQIPGPHSLGGT